MLEHKVFAEGLAKDMKKYLPPEYADVECVVVEKRKNNGTVMTGLAFRRPDERVSPIVYVEPFYQEVCQGKSMGEVLEEAAEAAQEVMERSWYKDFPDIGDYEKIKEYLGLQMVNTRANRKELQRLVHRNCEDLSLIPVLRFPVPDQDASGTVKISQKLMEQWGVGIDMVMDQAWKNTRQKEPPTLRGLIERLCMTITGHTSERNLLADNNPTQERPGEGMYVLSNRSEVNGSVYLASPEVMEKICALFPEGFYLLPSSVHEIIVKPKDRVGQKDAITPLELGEMVRDVNRADLSREEILSDRIYEYDRESGKIRQVPESIQKERGMER